MSVTPASTLKGSQGAQVADVETGLSGRKAQVVPLLNDHEGGDDSGRGVGSRGGGGDGKDDDNSSTGGGAAGEIYLIDIEDGGDGNAGASGDIVEHKAHDSSSRTGTQLLVPPVKPGSQLDRRTYQYSADRENILIS